MTGKRKLLLTTAFTVFLSLAWVGCRGFFVKPTLSSILLNPQTVSLQVGRTQQITATGVFDDNSRSDLTSSATWSSSNPNQVSVNNTGFVTALANTGTAGVTITATSRGISGTATVTVGQIQQTVTISPSTTSYSLSTTPAGTAINFTASVNGQTVTANWTSSNPAAISFTNASSGAAQIQGQGTTTITAVTSSGNGTLTITVGP